MNRLIHATGAAAVVLTACVPPKSAGPAETLTPSGRRGPPQIVATIPLDGAPFGSAVTTDGTGWIGQSHSASIARLDIAGARFTGFTPSGPPGSLPVVLYANADGSRLYAPNFGGVLASINTSSLAIQDTVRVSGDGYGIIATRAGDTVFAGTTSGRIYKVALVQQQVLGVLNLTMAAGWHFAWNADRSRLYAAERGFDGGRVYEIEPDSFRVMREFPTGDSPQAITLSRDGTKLLIAAEAGDVTIWDIASNGKTGSYTTGCQGYGIALEPDNSRLYVSCVRQGVVVVLDPRSGAKIATFNVGGSPRELSFDPTTSSLLVPNEGGWVNIIR